MTRPPYLPRTSTTQFGLIKLGTGFTQDADGTVNAVGGSLSYGSVTSETSFGQASSNGAASTLSRSDHTHGTPTNPITAHVAESDPHTQYALESAQGTMATQNANNVSITGGSVTGITDLTVADGGTGRSSATEYAVICGGTSTTNPHQSVASVGTSGHVLTSNGAGTLPTFQAPTGGGVGYTLPVLVSLGNPADASTYYYGLPTRGVTNGNNGASRIYIPKAGTVKAVTFFFNQTVGSSETSTMYLRVNDTTDTVISSAVTNDATNISFSNTAMSVAVSLGDFLELKWVTPTWVTNPNSVSMNAIIYIE